MTDTASSKTVFFYYQFTFPNGHIKKFDVRLDPETLNLLDPPRGRHSEWTRLSYHQCENCPLHESQSPQCPAAANLESVLDFFKDMLSYEEVDVEITTPARTYKKHTALQMALSSLIGVYMVTSGCPILDKLRPLVRTHLPFATLEETTSRAVSMYLMVQYFLKKRGKEPDWELKNLARIYEDVKTVNKFFHKRIAKIHIQDAGLNALVHLDCYARFTNTLLLEDDLHEIEKLFSVYLDSESGGTKPERTNGNRRHQKS